MMSQNKHKNKSASLKMLSALVLQISGDISLMKVRWGTIETKTLSCKICIRFDLKCFYFFRFLSKREISWSCRAKFRRHADFTWWVDWCNRTVSSNQVCIFLKWSRYNLKVLSFPKILYLAKAKYSLTHDCNHKSQRLKPKY